jgi:dTDP-4-dehydrorhamnose 3,5-epimerase
VAHGFQALSETAEVTYLLGALHDPSAERTIDATDPDLAIAWPLPIGTRSPKDAAAPPLATVHAELHHWFPAPEEST